MIITKQKPFAQIVKMLSSISKVFLVGCGECATVCKTGGEPEVIRMKEALVAHGKEVVGYCIPNAPCVASQLKAELAKHSQDLRKAEGVLVLACGLGVQSVKANKRFGYLVYPACDSLFAGVVDTSGAFLQKCSLCGECVLGQTSAVCPLTLCPKGILNGPCGGVRSGKCEINPENDCAWVMIYKEANAQQGGIDHLRQIKEPKDHSKGVYPQKLTLSKG